MLEIFLLAILAAGLASPQDSCQQRNYTSESIVCVCSEDYCDGLPPVQKIANSSRYIRYTSNRAGLRFKRTEEEIQTFTQDEDLANPINIDTSLEYQEIIGWGGAFTDASGVNIANLSKALQQRLLESYFGENSIEYTLCRVPIGCSDFSPRGYSYADTENDTELSTFSLQPEDFLYKIPFINQARELQNNMKVFASAWTSPIWMKTDPQWAGKGTIIEEYRSLWAKYFELFLDMYQENGVDIWGITTGNEPSLAKWPLQTTPTVAWTFENMRDFIKFNMGPTLKASNHSHVKIIALDDQRGYLPDLQVILNDTVVNETYVDGIGVHWYQDWYNGPELLNDAHEAFPDKFILATEACEGSFLWDQVGGRHVVLGSWSRAESFATDIIQDINHWVSGWVAWNMALNEQGGPTFTSNFVDSAIIVNATANEFYKQPMFYAHGHFSKFVPPGSRRIFTSQLTNDTMLMSAFKRPDDGIALVLLNKLNGTLPVNIVDGSIRISEVLTAKSITTILYWKD